MPQMAPMNWLLLFYYFLMIFFSTMIMNYYMFLYTPKNKLNIKMKKSNKNWKW